MTTAQVVETSVTVNNNSPIQDYVHPDDQTQPTLEMAPGFKPFTVKLRLPWHFWATVKSEHETRKECSNMTCLAAKHLNLEKALDKM